MDDSRRDLHTYKSDDLIFDTDVENEEEGYAVPGIFYSNQGHILGQVKFDGIIPVEDLIAMCNDKIQFLGEEAPEFDFRRAYSHWEWKWEIREQIGPTTTKIDYKSDRR